MYKIIGLLIVSLSLLAAGCNETTTTSDTSSSFVETQSTSTTNYESMGDDDYSSTRSYSSGDRDCSDFTSQRAAQSFYESEGPGDPHGLDRDGDGVACETLP